MDIGRIRRTFTFSNWFYCISTSIIITLALVNSIQSKFIFRPQDLAADHEFVFDRNFEEFHLDLATGEQINALYFPANHDAASKGVILYLHGNSKHIQHWGHNASDFVDRGYDFFIIDYRGFGKSKGLISEWNMYQDAYTAYKYLATIYKREEIIIYGRSIGTGVASWLASQEDAKMLILETPFYNMEDLLKTKLRVPSIPINLRYNFPTHEYLPKIDYPVHMFHGTKDKITPYRSAMKLQPLLKESDSFTVIENGKHKNLSDFDLFHFTLDQIL